MLNIVICGTPGTGKSTIVEHLKEKLKEFSFLNLSSFAIDNECTSGYDEILGCHEIDEDKLLEKITPILRADQPNIIESIHVNLLPEDLIDYVFVCRTDNTVLFDRLKARSYNENKLTNNLQAEIFQLIFYEALEFVGGSYMTELINNNKVDLEKNIETIVIQTQKLLEGGNQQ